MHHVMHHAMHHVMHYGMHYGMHDVMRSDLRPRAALWSGPERSALAAGCTDARRVYGLRPGAVQCRAHGWSGVSAFAPPRQGQAPQGLLLTGVRDVVPLSKLTLVGA